MEPGSSYQKPPAEEERRAAEEQKEQDKQQWVDKRHLAEAQDDSTLK
ncbi:ATP synthase subunit e, mitochondrial-like [Canis lupus familiaris]|nr:ATP synthase subunit e, mitochondrial-like [Canis lupus familiaris]